MKTRTLILGAGIGGLSAAAELKDKQEEDFIIVDKNKELPQNFHNGLHYLHSCDFGTPFSFEFKKCILTEEIWNTKTNEFKKNATIPEMFEYSKKIMENLRHPSSIMDPGKRNEVWIPLSNSMNDLPKAYHDYIGEEKFEWNFFVKKIDTEKKIVTFNVEENLTDFISYENLISTIPIPTLYHVCGLKSPYDFKQKTIYINNYQTTNVVSNWLIVLYMSDPKFLPYRITAFNNLISMESLIDLTYEDEIVIKYLIGNLFEYDLKTKTNYKWDTGRIFGLQKLEREQMVKDFAEKNIHLIGRFAQWNGKLLIDGTILQAKELINKI